MTNDSRESATGMPFGISEIATAFFRHKKKAIAFVVLVSAMSGLVLLYAPRTYRSEARLFLQVGRESVRLDPTATTGQTLALQQNGRDNEVATAIEVLRSQGVLEKAVDRLTPEVVLGEKGAGKATSNPTFDIVMAPLHRFIAAVKSIDPISKREEAIILLGKNLEVEAETDSTIVSIKCDAESAALAQTILGEIVNVFREEHARLHQMSGSKPFFTQQRDNLQQELSSAEQALREAKNRMGIGSVEGRRVTLEEQLSNIELTRNGVVQAIASAEARVQAIQEQLKASPEMTHLSTRVVPNTGADTLRSQLYSLQVELMKLEAKLSDDHPLVASMKEQVDEARRMLQGEESQREETVERLNETHKSLELELAQVQNQLAGHKAQLEQLDEQHGAAIARLQSLNDSELEIHVLERTVTLAQKDFFRYSEDLEQARVDEELNQRRISNVAVAQEPTFGEKPVNPSKLIVAALTLAVLGAGTPLLVLGCEHLNGSVNSVDQVESVLRIPVLATIPDGRAYASASFVSKA